MRKQLIGIGVLLLLLLVVGGIAAAAEGLEIIGQTIAAFLPVFKPILVQSFKEYLSSARFITAVIVLALSSAGIYLTAKKKKTLFMIVTILLDVIMLISIVANLARCS